MPCSAAGLRGAVQPPFDRVIAAINAAGAACSPSIFPAADSDTGRPQAVRAVRRTTRHRGRAWKKRIPSSRPPPSGWARST